MRNVSLSSHIVELPSAIRTGSPIIVLLRWLLISTAPSIPSSSILGRRSSSCSSHCCSEHFWLCFPFPSCPLTSWTTWAWQLTLILILLGLELHVNLLISTPLIQHLFLLISDTLGLHVELFTLSNEYLLADLHVFWIGYFVELTTAWGTRS